MAAQAQHSTAQHSTARLRGERSQIASLLDYQLRRRVTDRDVNDGWPMDGRVGEHNDNIAIGP